MHALRGGIIMVTKNRLQVRDFVLGFSSGILSVVITVAIIVMTESSNTMIAMLSLLSNIVLISIIFVCLSESPLKSLIRALLSLLTYAVLGVTVIYLRIPYHLIVLIFGELIEDNNAAGMIILLNLFFTFSIHIVLIIVHIIRCIVHRFRIKLRTER